MLSLGLNVLWMARCKYIYTNCIDLHSHDLYHYIFVVDGAGIIEIDGKEYTLKRKNFYLTPKNIEHWFEADDKAGLQTIEVKFNLSDPSVIEKANQLPVIMEGNRFGIEKSLEFMMDEALEKGELYTDIINIKFCEILLYMIKKNMVDNDTAKDINIDYNMRENDSLFEPVISYMRKNMGLPMDLNDLSSMTHLNKTYFCKMFTLKYGISPIRYLNEMRISKAKELLHYSDKNITQISYEVGFQSVHYFSRYFTQKEGIGPYEYKQKSKGNVYVYLDGSLPMVL
jgi:AraC-type DNA-binding domain-containing proteins